MFFTVTKVIASALTTQHPQALNIFFSAVYVLTHVKNPFFSYEKKLMLTNSLSQLWPTIQIFVLLLVLNTESLLQTRCFQLM